MYISTCHLIQISDTIETKTSVQQSFHHGRKNEMKLVSQIRGEGEEHTQSPGKEVEVDVCLGAVTRSWGQEEGRGT